MPALVTTSLWVPELLPVQPIIAVWSWIYSLYFLGGLDSTGAYVSMLWDVFTNMGSFFAVLLVVILGLGHSFALATQNENIIKQLQQVYRMGIMGDFEIDDYEVDGKDLEQHALLYIFFVLITLAITVTMLNLLIAVISDTYERVSAVMVSTKNRARAGRIAELERSYGKLRLGNKCHLKFLRPTHTSDESDWQGRLNYLSKIIPRKIEKSMQGEFSNIKDVPQQLKEMQGKLNKDLPQQLKDLPQQMQEMQGQLGQLKALPEQLQEVREEIKALREGRTHCTHVQDVQRHGNPGVEWLPVAPVLE